MTHLTPEEKLALSLIFRFLGAISLNLTTSQYAAIAARAPELKVLHYAVNRALEDMAIAGYSWEICSFKRGDRYYRNATSPVSMSLETVRSAWVKSGMRELQVLCKRFEGDIPRAVAEFDARYFKMPNQRTA